jgi:hypothetical protein
MTSLEGFLTRRFCFGFIMLSSRTFFFGMRILTVCFLGLDGVFFRDSNVPFMPAWAIDTALWTSSSRFFIPMAPHARAAQLSLVLAFHTLLVPELPKMLRFWSQF